MAGNEACGAPCRLRTYDIMVNSHALYQAELKEHVATPTGLEPVTSGVTGRRSNQLNYEAKWS